MNNTKLPTWKERNTFEKILVIMGFIISITIIILAALHLSGVKKSGNMVIPLLMGLFMIIQGFQYRKYNKFIFFFSLSVGIFNFITAIIIFMEG
ncbi:MAG: hypothetical protein GX275_08755 [Clostridiales bacterium]|nr:hypothetical protein [Clostridiales bacterium]